MPVEFREGICKLNCQIQRPNVLSTPKYDLFPKSCPIMLHYTGGRGVVHGYIHQNDNQLRCLKQLRYWGFFFRNWFPLHKVKSIIEKRNPCHTESLYHKPTTVHCNQYNAHVFMQCSWIHLRGAYFPVADKGVYNKGYLKFATILEPQCVRKYVS